MTDNEIIKALECCINADCKCCPHYIGIGIGQCEEMLMKEMYDLLYRKDAEIEASKNSKSEAIKEFAVRVKMEVNFILLYYKLDRIAPTLDHEIFAVIERIEKEMTEGRK